MSTVAAPRRSGPYHINIQGLPAGYTWQDLKDLVREHASHGIRTDLLAVRGSNGDRTRGGWVRVSYEDEAHKLYEYLTRNRLEGRSLHVELWDVSDAVPATLLQRNYHQNAHQVAQGRDTDAHGNQVAGQSVVQPAPRRNVMYPVQPMAAPLIGPVYYQIQPHPAPIPISYPMLPHPAPYPQPRYATRSDGIQINVSNGAALTEARGVFVSGLDYSLRKEDVEAVFGRAGAIKECKLARTSSGKSKGSATVRYFSAEAAQTAIQTLNGRQWKDRVLQVRGDREEFTVTPPARDTMSRSRAAARNERLVVDGSRTARRSG